MEMMGRNDDDNDSDADKDKDSDERYGILRQDGI